MMKKLIFVAILALTSSIFGNIGLPENQNIAREMSTPSVKVMPSLIICEPTRDKNFIVDAMQIGGIISPQWPEIIVALMIINENAGTKSDRIVVAYNNYAIIVRPQADGDMVHEFLLEKISEKSKEKIPGLVNPPTGETEKKLILMGFKVVDLKENGKAIYLEMPTSEVELFLSRVDAALILLFPSWQNGARQTIAAIAQNSKSKIVQIPYNQYWINIFDKAFDFSGGKCKFILGVSEIK